MALINSPPLDAVTSPDIESKPRNAASWMNFFNQVFRICSSVTESGTTANRPTVNLWVGRTYYDTTLNLPIWINAVNPAVVWKDAAGNTV
jgi:hypothetical protein